MGAALTQGVGELYARATIGGYDPSESYYILLSETDNCHELDGAQV